MNKADYQNVLETNGCSPAIETKKTKDKNKVNLISSVINKVTLFFRL